MGDIEKGKLGFIFRIAIGLMIAVCSVLPSFVYQLIRVVEFLKGIKPPQLPMSLTDIGSYFIGHLDKYYIVFAIAGLAGALFAFKFGRSAWPGWLVALCFFALSHILGFMVQVGVELSYDGLIGAFIAGFFYGPMLAAAEQFGSPITVLSWLVCFMSTQFIAIGLRKRLSGNPN